MHVGQVTEQPESPEETEVAEAPVAVEPKPANPVMTLFEEINAIYKAARKLEPDKTRPATLWLTDEMLVRIADLAESLYPVGEFLTAESVKQLFIAGARVRQAFDPRLMDTAVQAYMNHCFACEVPIGIAALGLKGQNAVLADALLSGIIGDLIAVGELDRLDENKEDEEGNDDERTDPEATDN